MEFLTQALEQVPAFDGLRNAVSRQMLPAAVSGVSTVHKSNIIYSLCALTKHRAFVVAADESEAQKFIRDLEAMGMRPMLYPLRDFNLRGGASMSRDYEHARLAVLNAIKEGDCDCVVTCIDGALQYTLSKKELSELTFFLEEGQEIDLEKISCKLVQMGYEKAPQTEGAGQFSARGGILDVFSPGASAPFRIELWGDEIDTISLFDPTTQRRGDRVSRACILPAAEALIPSPGLLAKKLRELASSLRGKTAAAAKSVLQQEWEALENGVLPSNGDKFIPLLQDDPETLLDYPDSSWLFFASELSRIKEKEKAFSWQWGEDLKDLLAEGILCRGLDQYARDWPYALSRFERRGVIYLDVFARGGYDTPVRYTAAFTARQLSPWSGSMAQLTEDLHTMLYNKWACVVLAGNERSAKNTADDLNRNGIAASYEEAPQKILPGQVVVTGGSLSSGLEYPAASFGLITHGQLLSAKKSRRAKRKNARDISSLSELSQGDYVVHAAHGIGIFDGIHKIDMQGVTKDYIKIKYAKGDILYVPVTQLDLVSKYIGSKDDATVRVHKLGGTEWQKAKAKVRSGVKDIAKDLIQIYSQRMKA